MSIARCTGTKRRVARKVVAPGSPHKPANGGEGGGNHEEEQAHTCSEPTRRADQADVETRSSVCGKASARTRRARFKWRRDTTHRPDSIAADPVLSRHRGPARGRVRRVDEARVRARGRPSGRRNQAPGKPPAGKDR